MSDYELVEATTEDLEIILQHRRWMFEDMGVGTNQSLNDMDDAFEEWVLPRIESGEFKTWFIVDEDEIVSGVGVWIYDLPPRPNPTHPKCGHVLNMYTATDYRRQGLARQLMEHVIEYAKENEISQLTLKTSDEGKTLYDSLGFVNQDELILYLNQID